jgi:hypothetical protein
MWVFMLFKGVYIECRILDSCCACVYHLIVFHFDLLHICGIFLLYPLLGLY